MFSSYVCEFGIIDILSFTFIFIFEISRFLGLKCFKSVFTMVHCVRNSYYNFIPINLKLCRSLCHGL